MPLVIRLLGRPSIEVDGVTKPLAGQKPWALLASVILAPRGMSRRDLAERIWPEADDPLAATRWAVLQVRRALQPLATLREVDGRLTAEGATAGPVIVDAQAVLDAQFTAEQVEDVVRGELLAGMAFDDAPDLEQWLVIERARLSSAASASLRWAATVLGRTDPDRAVRLLGRALAVDPFDDAAHELLVDVLVGRGRNAEALAHLALAERRYRDELGVDPPITLRRPFERRRQAEDIAVAPEVTARALLESAVRRSDAGDYDGALDVARRASTAAGRSGDGALEASALAVLGEILVHSIRGRDREAVGLLDRALRLALDVGDMRLAAQCERELAWIAMLSAAYGAAESLARRAIERSATIGDEAGIGRALTIVGASQSDRTSFVEAEATLLEAVRRLAAVGDRWEAFAQAFLARVRLRTGRDRQAREDGARSVRLARELGWLSLLPWPMVVEGEAALAGADRDAAARTFDEAYALAVEIGDPCWRAFALRGRALVADRDGEPDAAIRLLRDAVEAATSLPDVYAWCQAVALVDLVEAQGTPAVDHVAMALDLTRRGPMPDLLDRLNRANVGARQGQTPGQTH